MVDTVFNIARAAAYHDNVEQNSPAGCELVVMAVVSTETHDAMANTDDFGALLALTNCAEATNTNYARKILVAADITQTVDDTNNWVDQDITVDPVWSSVAAGDNWTHLVIGYDPLGTGVNANIIPLTVHDFSVTPNGGDITAQLAASGYYRAS